MNLYSTELFTSAVANATQSSRLEDTIRNHPAPQAHFPAAVILTNADQDPWTLEPRVTAHPRCKLVEGVGINDCQNASRQVDGTTQLHPAYIMWRNLLKRTYCPAFKARQAQRYADVASEWLSLRSFYAWWLTQPYYVRGNLDSDLLAAARGLDKAYTPETATYVPHQINTLLADCKGKRGEWPQGVSWNKREQKFKAELTMGGKSTYLGYFDSAADASAAYWAAKWDYVPTRASELLIGHPERTDLLLGIRIILEQQHAEALAHTANH